MPQLSGGPTSGPGNLALPPHDRGQCTATRPRPVKTVTPGDRPAGRAGSAPSWLAYPCCQKPEHQTASQDAPMPWAGGRVHPAVERRPVDLFREACRSHHVPTITSPRSGALRRSANALAYRVRAATSRRGFFDSTDSMDSDRRLSPRPDEARGVGHGRPLLAVARRHLLHMGPRSRSPHPASTSTPADSLATTLLIRGRHRNRCPTVRDLRRSSSCATTNATRLTPSADKDPNIIFRRNGAGRRSKDRLRID